MRIRILIRKLLKFVTVMSLFLGFIILISPLIDVKWILDIKENIPCIDESTSWRIIFFYFFIFLLDLAYMGFIYLKNRHKGKKAIRLCWEKYEQSELGKDFMAIIESSAFLILSLFVIIPICD